MNKLFIILIAPALILLSCSSPNNEGVKKYDTTAIENLDELSETIGKLNSCSYTLNTIVSKDKDSENITAHNTYYQPLTQDGKNMYQVITVDTSSSETE